MPSDLPDATAAVGVTEPPVTGNALPAPDSAVPPGQLPCPRCGHPMPDLKGGTASICAVCGFKDSCCF